MRKNNKELKYNEPVKKKLTKFNYVVIIVPIVLVLLLVAGIAFYVFVYNSDSNKLKKYLESEGYVCNTDTCTKDVGNEIYTIDYVHDTFTVDSVTMQIRVGQGMPVVDVKDKEVVCTYIKDNYNGEMVDESFRYTRECESYVSEVNRYLNYYKELKSSALKN